MTKDLEIVDDAGDEFYATNIPIPFYIRLKLESEKTKYRAKILDEAGNTRSFYTGVTDRNFLELHVPVIPLRDKGKIIVEIEVSDIGSEDSTKHQATIDYVSQEEYESIKETERSEEVITGESGTSLLSQYEKIDETPQESPELTSDEVAYLTQRTDSFEVKEEIEEVKSDGEIEEPATEPSTNLENSTEESERSAELSVDEIAYLIPGTETLNQEDEKIEDNLEVKEFESRASAQIEELNGEKGVSAELSVDELAYLTQRAEILSELEKEDTITEQISSLDIDEEE